MSYQKKRNLLLVCLFSMIFSIGIMFSVPFQSKSSKAIAVGNLESQVDSTSLLRFSLINDSTEYKVSIADKTAEYIYIPQTYNGKPVTEIASNGFLGCNNLIQIVIPKSVKVIGTSAFLNCKNLTTVAINSLIEIKSNAFASCTKLDNIIIPETVDILGSSVFRSLPNTSTIHMRAAAPKPQWSPQWDASCEATVLYSSDYMPPFKVDTIEKNGVTGYSITGYQGIQQLGGDYVVPESLDGPAGQLPVLDIEQFAFSDCSFNSLTIEGSTNINSYAFLEADIKSIELSNTATFSDPTIDSPDSIEEMCRSVSVFAFSTVESITLPASLDIIPSNTFSGCMNLNEIKTTDSTYAQNKLPRVTRLGSGAFTDCVSLISLTLPDSIVQAGDNIFVGWSSEQTIYFEFFSIPITGWDSNWDGGEAQKVFSKFEITFNSTYAYFTPLNFSVDSDGKYFVAPGQTVRFKAELKEEYSSRNLKIYDNGVEIFVNSNGEYFISNVAENHTITVAAVSLNNYSVVYKTLGAIENPANYGLNFWKNEAGYNYYEKSYFHFDTYEIPDGYLYGYHSKGWLKNGVIIGSDDIVTENIILEEWLEPNLYQINYDTGIGIHTATISYAANKKLTDLLPEIELSSDFTLTKFYLDDNLKEEMPTYLADLGDSFIDHEPNASGISSTITLYGKLNLMNKTDIYEVPNECNRLYLSNSNGLGEELRIRVHNTRNKNLKLIFENFTSDLSNTNNKGAVVESSTSYSLQLVFYGTNNLLGSSGRNSSVSDGGNGASAIYSNGPLFIYILEEGKLFATGGNGGYGASLGGNGAPAVHAEAGITFERIEATEPYYTIDDDDLHIKLLGGNGGMGKDIAATGGNAGDGIFFRHIGNFKFKLTYAKIIGGIGGSASVAGVNNTGLAGNGGHGINATFNEEASTQMSDLWLYFYDQSTIILSGGEGGANGNKETRVGGLGGSGIFNEQGGVWIQGLNSYNGNLEIYAGANGKSYAKGNIGRYAASCNTIEINNMNVYFYGGKGSSSNVTGNCGSGGAPLLVNEESMYITRNSYVYLYGGNGGTNDATGSGGTGYIWTGLEQSKFPNANFYNGNNG